MPTESIILLFWESKKCCIMYLWNADTTEQMNQELNVWNNSLQLNSFIEKCHYSVGLIWKYSSRYLIKTRLEKKTNNDRRKTRNKHRFSIPQKYIIIINFSLNTCFTSEYFDNEILWMLKRATYFWNKFSRNKRFHWKSKYSIITINFNLSITRIIEKLDFWDANNSTNFKHQ